MALNHSLLLLKVSISILVFWLVHSELPKHLDILQPRTSSEIKGAIYGSCQPVEQLQELNAEILPKLSKIVVSDRRVI